MRNFKKVLALLLATLMVAAMAMSAVLAADGDSSGTTHTVTITNTDQNVTHNYEVYQIFKGDLDKAGQGSKLSNIEWGNGVDGAALLAALKATTVDPELTWQGDELKVVEPEVTSGTTVITPAKTIAKGESLFKFCETAADVADVLSTFASTGAWEKSGSARSGSGLNDQAGAIDAFANIVSQHLATKTADFTSSGTSYTAKVDGDGYYFIKDVTKKLSGTTASGTNYSETLSKYILAVVRDTTVVAKDTGITTKKEINESGTKVAANSKNIGDTVTFDVTVDVPNTRKYEDHFIFIMNDVLPAGLTFTGIKSVKAGSFEFSDAKKNNDPYKVSEYDGTAGYYTLKVNAALPTITSGAYEFEGSTYDAVAAAGGQKIELTFNEFKKVAEKNNLSGKIIITYTAVVNDDALFTATENENEVTFVYSNDPNHDYNGDNPSGTDPVGETPKSTTRTYTTSLQIFKVDDSGENPLSGAIFQLTSEDAMNRTVVTGYKYELPSYVPSGLGETVDTTTKYWKLKDGSYTTTDPATPNLNTSKYEDTETYYYKVTFNVVEEASGSQNLIVVSNDAGIIQFTGLDAGTYTLEEIAAPEGFNKIDGQATVTIKWADPESSGTPADFTAEEWAKAKDQGGYYITATEFAKDFTFVNDESGSSYFKLTVVNKSGTELPSTGGIGTTIFYIVGGLLAVGAGVVLVAKKRMGKVEE